MNNVDYRAIKEADAAEAREIENAERCLEEAIREKAEMNEHDREMKRISETLRKSLSGLVDREKSKISAKKIPITFASIEDFLAASKVINGLGDAAQIERDRIHGEAMAECARMTAKLQDEYRATNNARTAYNDAQKELNTIRKIRVEDILAPGDIVPEPSKKCPKCDKHRVSLNVMSVVAFLQSVIIVWMYTLI